MTIRNRVGLLKLRKLHRCSSCGEKYLAHRVFRDPEDGKTKCWPSCFCNAQDVKALAEIPDIVTDPRLLPPERPGVWGD